MNFEDFSCLKLPLVIMKVRLMKCHGQEKVEDINSQEKDLHINQSESVKGEMKENADIQGEGLKSSKVPENPPRNLKNESSGVAEAVQPNENLRTVLAKVLPSKDRGFQLPSDSKDQRRSNGIKDSEMALNGENQHVLHEQKIVHRPLDAVPEKSPRYDPTNRVESQGILEVQPHQKQRKQMGEKDVLESDQQVQPHLHQGIRAEVGTHFSTV